MCPFVLAPPGTVDVVSPWELQLENQPVYKYANVPRGAAYLYFCDMTCCLLCMSGTDTHFSLQFYLVLSLTAKPSLLLPTRLMVQKLLMY
jgi:hypothetical protein